MSIMLNPRPASVCACPCRKAKGRWGRLRALVETPDSRYPFNRSTKHDRQDRNGRHQRRTEDWFVEIVFDIEQLNAIANLRKDISRSDVSDTDALFKWIRDYTYKPYRRRSDPDGIRSILVRIAAITDAALNAIYRERGPDPEALRRMRETVAQTKKEWDRDAEIKTRFWEWVAGWDAADATARDLPEDEFSEMVARMNEQGEALAALPALGHHPAGLAIKAFLGMWAGNHLSQRSCAIRLSDDTVSARIIRGCLADVVRVLPELALLCEGVVEKAVQP
jgi:hypothetical protein